MMTNPRRMLPAVLVWTVAVAWSGAAVWADGLPASKEWSRDQAAHLLRRAGFGGSPAQVDYLHKLGREKAVDCLLKFESPMPTATVERINLRGDLYKKSQPKPDREEIQKILAQRRRADQLQLQKVVQWWIETMVSSPDPLREKMVLFWHGLFTSGHREVKSSYALYQQNQLFRRNATGNFRTLVLAVTHDPAMIVYLNTRENVKGKPNENYARELFELFTLGVGHYTENDIKEAARALTGIKLNPENGQQVFLPRQHDYGLKTIFGKTGDFDAEDVVDLVMQQPACAEYVARRLWTFFAYENPEPEIVTALAKTLRDNKYELKPVLREMFLADAFYDKRATFTHIKSPVELMVGTARMLEIPPLDATVIERSLRAMGQQLMQPPNVKGWDGGAAWITTSTLYNRYNAPASLVFGTDNAEFRRRRAAMEKLLEETVGREAMMMEGEPLLTPQPAYDVMKDVAAAKLATPEAVVDYYLGRLLQRPIDAARRQVLVDTLKQDLGGRKLADAAAAPAIRGVIHLILSMPEYQLS